jgi:UDP-N-acetylmuramoylalanine--D-glutamate ligase
MTPATTFAGRRVALFGLGGSGLATARALKAGGAEVVACDDNVARMEAAAREGIGTGDLRGADWSGFAALVLSPGVPLTHPEPHWTVPRAHAAGVEIIGDIELFCRERAKIAPGAPFVAITGTNGKSTTTALVAHMLREAGRDVQMGGNIGTAVLSLDPPAADRVHVIEMSSFQIDLTPSLNPSVGVLLNITPDHLDRHGDMERYAAIKERLVAGADLAVVGDDDTWTRSIRARLATGGGRLVVIGEASRASHAVAIGPDRLDLSLGGAARSVSLAGISSLRGVHNGQNAAAAAAIAWALGLDPKRRKRDCGPSPASITAWRGRAPGGRDLRQRFEGDQRRLDREGSLLLRPRLLDRRRQAEGGRHRAP